MNYEWNIPPQVMEYLEYEIGCYDFKVIHQRPLGVLLNSVSMFMLSKPAVNPQPQKVVIKIISLETKRLKNEFKREVEIHSRIQNSSPLFICKLLKSKRIRINATLKTEGHEVGVMIMEKMGMDLMDYILNTKFIPIATIKMIFKVICQSVLECHKQGITHLDLKPENILLNLLGRAITDIKLCDFGCSVLHQSTPSIPKISFSSLKTSKSAPLLETCPERFGTLEYLPPECIRNRRLSAPSWDMENYNDKKISDEKIDVHSLGVILFVMMSKRFPKVYSHDVGNNTSNNKEENIEIVQCLVDTTAGNYFECLKSFNRGCSNDCANLIAWMMNDNTEHRPSMNEVLSHPYFT